jgi:hypothetical protein
MIITSLTSHLYEGIQGAISEKLSSMSSELYVQLVIVSKDPAILNTYISCVPIRFTTALKFL